jgi:hypothetical protein
VQIEHDEIDYLLTLEVGEPNHLTLRYHASVAVLRRNYFFEDSVEHFLTPCNICNKSMAANSACKPFFGF